jgi:hypothetical protein
MVAMGDVIDRWRLNQGWNPYDNDTQMLAIQSWVHILDAEKIPAEAYGELFERALSLRALAIAQNKNLPNFGAELLLACWMGENGLCREMEQRRINSGRYLGDNAASVCRHCHGSGWRTIKEGNYSFAKKCDHRDI